jgi:hypothetical protein
VADARALLAALVALDDAQSTSIPKWRNAYEQARAFLAQPDGPEVSYGPLTGDPSLDHEGSLRVYGNERDTTIHVDASQPDGPHVHQWLDEHGTVLYSYPVDADGIPLPTQPEGRGHSVKEAGDALVAALKGRIRAQEPEA